MLDRTRRSSRRNGGLDPGVPLLVWVSDEEYDELVRALAVAHPVKAERPPLDAWSREVLLAAARRYPGKPQRPTRVSEGRRQARLRNLWGTLATQESRAIAQALVDCAGNQTHAAAQLGISRRTLINKMRKYGFKSSRLTTAP